MKMQMQTKSWGIIFTVKVFSIDQSFHDSSKKVKGDEQKPRSQAVFKMQINSAKFPPTFTAALRECAAFLM